MLANDGIAALAKTMPMLRIRFSFMTSDLPLGLRIPNLG
jgi:hypothetical protein